MNKMHAIDCKVFGDATRQRNKNDLLSIPKTVLRE